MHGIHTCTLIYLSGSADVNECELEIHTCHSNANCTDTDGSFNCTCREGFEGDGFNCTGTKHILHKPHHAYKITINPRKMKPITTHAAYIICLVTLYIFVYVDIPECERELDDCDSNANCINIYGSYSCICNTGFTGDGFICAG